MKFAALVIVALSILMSEPVLACKRNTDCATGSKCVKERGHGQGICIAGRRPGNANDDDPFVAKRQRDRNLGKTCTRNTQCGPRLSCFKESGKRQGVCAR